MGYLSEWYYPNEGRELNAKTGTDQQPILFGVRYWDYRQLPSPSCGDTQGTQFRAFTSYRWSPPQYPIHGLADPFLSGKFFRKGKTFLGRGEKVA